MDRLLLVSRERKVPADHDAFGHGRVAAEPELGGDDAFVHLPGPRESGLFAMNGDPPPRNLVVLKSPAKESRRGHGAAVIGEACGSSLGKLDHLRELAAFLPLADCSEEP